MDYKGYKIAILYDEYSHRFSVGVSRDGKQIYETESWHESEDEDFKIEESYEAKIKKMIDEGKFD